MKKFLAVAAFALATTLHAQSPEYTTPLNEVAVEKNQTAGSVGGGSTITGGTCTNQFVRSLDTAGLPTCASVVNADITNATINLTTKVTGTLPVGNGGTGVATITNHGVVIGQAASAVAATSAGNAGEVLTSGGASADPTYQDIITRNRANSSWFDDFEGTNTAATSSGGNIAGWTLTNSGGARISAPAGIVDADHPGVFAYEIDTSTDNGVLQMGPGTVLFKNGMKLEWLARIEDLSTGTDRYTLRYGFLNQNLAVGTGTNGCWFEYIDNVNSGAWTINCRSNNGGAPATTTSNTASTPAADTWYRMAITYESGVGVHFYIDGVEVTNSPINTTNVPDQAQEVTGVAFQFIKSVGNTARDFYIDYAGFQAGALGR